MAAYSPGTDRGIREHDGLYEINETSAMCVYIENEFHDNPTLAEWIVAHTEELGEQYAKGMCAAEGKVYVGPGTAPKPSKPEKPDEPETYSNMMGQRGPKPERKYSMEYDPSVQQLQMMLKNNIGWRTEIDRSLSGQFPVKPGAGFKVPSDKGGAGKQGIFMAHGMTADGMAVGDHLTDQLRMVPGMISDDKKGGGNIFVFQQVKQDGGITDIRPVVKS